MIEQPKGIVFDASGMTTTFAGVKAQLAAMAEDGTIDRWNAACDAREVGRDLVLVVFADGSFCIQTGADAEVLAVGDPDYVAALNLPAVEAAIRDAKKKVLN